MLYELLWNLVDAHGINDDNMPEFNEKGVATTGRFLFVQLIVDSFKLMRCSPHFEQSRDAILDADKALTDGENECLIWKAFAKRGLGVGAATLQSDSETHMNVTASTTVPTNC